MLINRSVSPGRVWLLSDLFPAGSPDPSRVLGLQGLLGEALNRLRVKPVLVLARTADPKQRAQPFMGELPAPV